MTFVKMMKKSASIYKSNVAVTFMKEGKYFLFGLFYRGSKADGCVCSVYFLSTRGTSSSSPQIESVLNRFIQHTTENTWWLVCITQSIEVILSCENSVFSWSLLRLTDLCQVIKSSKQSCGAENTEPKPLWSGLT